MIVMNNLNTKPVAELQNVLLKNKFLKQYPKGTIGLTLAFNFILLNLLLCI